MSTMRLNCPSCGHSIDLHHIYDNYKGRVKCLICGAFLTICVEKGRVRHVSLVLRTPQEDTTAYSMST